MPLSDDTYPLHEAVVSGSLNALSKQISDGNHDINAQNIAGQSALHWAASRGHVEMVRLLLDNGASPNTPDNSGKTPLHWASERGRAECIKLLLQYGVGADCQDKKGNTPLIATARSDLCDEHNAVEALCLLIQHGVNKEIANNDGVTALRAATLRQKTTLAQILRDRESKTTIRDSPSQTR